MILEDAAAQPGTTRILPLAFAVIGILLFGAGVISFFAANWGVIPKAIKMALLFGAMWAAFAGAGALLGVKGPTGRGIGHALLLLGVILFGANIMLIAQIYHISSHFPNGVFLWTLGAVVVTYLAPSEILAVSALLLGGLWASLSIFGPPPNDLILFVTAPYADVVHWPSLAALALLMPAVLVGRWRQAARLAALGLVAWWAVALASLAHENQAQAANALAAGLFVAAALFLVGAALERKAPLQIFGDPLRRLALIAGVLTLYGLTLRMVHGFGDFDFPRGEARADWAIATLLAAFAIVIVVSLLYRRLLVSQRGGYFFWGYALMVAVVALVAVTLLAPGIPTAPVSIYIGFNVLFLGTIVWLIYAGARQNDRFLVNSGFLFFSLGLATLFFDNFWNLVQLSLFFMGAGLLVFGGGFVLERQRRRLIRAAAPEHPPAEGPP